MNRAPWTAALLLALGCVTPLDEGERLYREGDRHAASTACAQLWENVLRAESP